MCLLNPENPDIAFARDCVINTLMDIPDSYGAAFVIADEQTYLAAMVRRNHDRNCLMEAAKTLSRPGRRGRKRTGHVIDLEGRRIA